MIDDFGDRMKALEGVEAKRRLDVNLPVCVRIDGKGFSKFTKPFKKDGPFSPAILASMQYACKNLVEETHAKIGYVQSDEITLIFSKSSDEGSIIFDGRVQKLVSVFSSMASSFFTKKILEYTTLDKFPVFDARAWNVPSKEEAANTILWRSQDCRKNAISQVCRHYATTKEMFGLNQEAMVSLMFERGVDFHLDFTQEERFGTYYKRVIRMSEIEDDVWYQIPENKRPESRLVNRSKVVKVPMGYFGNYSNRAGIIFNNEEPQLK